MIVQRCSLFFHLASNVVIAQQRCSLFFHLASNVVIPQQRCSLFFFLANSVCFFFKTQQCHGYDTTVGVAQSGFRKVGYYAGLSVDDNVYHLRMNQRSTLSDS